MNILRQHHQHGGVTKHLISAEIIVLNFAQLTLFQVQRITIAAALSLDVHVEGVDVLSEVRH